jgi:hypothetical protein
MRRRRSVFLAAAPSDAAVMRWRELLAMELRARGRRVLPDDARWPAAWDEDGLDTARGSGLAVHVLSGENVPAHLHSGDPWAECLKAAAAAGVPRVIAVSGVAAGTESAVIDALVPAPSVDILVNKGLEAVKDVITERLALAWTSPGAAPPRVGTDRQSRPATRPSPDTDTPAPSATTLQRIYLVWDDRDDPVASPGAASALRAHLHSLGFEVKVPIGRDNTPRDRRVDNKEKLKQADGVLLYWGQTSEAWLEARIRELAQALGWREARPFRVSATYVSLPATPYKQRFTTREVDIIVKQFHEFSTHDLAAFVHRLRGDTGPA